MTSRYTDAIADEIVARIGKGEPLAVMCREPHMPATSTVSDWCAAMPAFAARFSKARDMGYDALAAECLAIANTPVEGVSVKTGGKDGDIVTREDMLGHRKLQIETRLKLLAKWDPKRYGDKLDVNATHAGEIRIVVGGDAE